MYVCMYVTVYVGGCMRLYGRVHVCVCARVDRRSKIGTNQCMLNTSRMHLSAKEVCYPLVAFSLKTHFCNISMKTIT